MAGNQSQRAMLHDMHRAAVGDALQFVVDEQLVDVRLGAGGHIREAPSDVIFARFHHFTSRSGDPNVHSHAVLLNILSSKNTPSSKGRFLTAEPKKLFGMQKVVGRAYASSLALRLSENGFSIRAAGRDQFEIAGIAEELIEKFSKRSHQIEELVGRDASAAHKEVAALATRSAKHGVPVGEALEARWAIERAEIVSDPWMTARAFVRGREIGKTAVTDLDQPEIIGSGPVAIAASKLFHHESVISRKDLLFGALVEATMTAVAIDTVRAELELFEQRNILIRLAGKERGECWTTPAIASVEASLLRAADRDDEHDWFQSQAVDAALADAPFLSDEQAQAVRISANRDGVALCAAAAGTGKTTLARVLIEAAHRSNLKTLGLSPSWVGADELSRSCGIETFSIAKWRHDHLAGVGCNIDGRTLVVVDEAGMSGVRELEYILRRAQEVGAKVVCFGDIRQLESVQNGSALRSVIDVVARGAVLSQVRRQDVEWQRAASTVMAQGDSEAGLRTYAKHGRLELVSTEAAAQARVIEVWKNYRQRYGEDVLIITRRNGDAGALNQAARMVLRAEGHLRGQNCSLMAVSREGKIGLIELAQGDRIRFGENLSRLAIRNGTRGMIENIESYCSDPKMGIRLEDGRLVEERWSALVRERRGFQSSPPRVSLAYAGTAYSVQARTSAAAVVYIAKPTDARAIYVGLTRHKIDAYVIAEQDRLEGTVRGRQSDIRVNPSKAAVLEQLFMEARSYSEKANVADYVADRITFIRTGQVEVQRELRPFNLGRAAQTARRMLEATWETASDLTSPLTRWRLAKSIHYLHRQLSVRLAKVIRAVASRMQERTSEPTITRDWDISR
jgi:hypothetical protein